MTIEFTTPELTELTPKICVFGVGGAGGNAVNNMIDAGLEGIDFIVANTDAQALAHSKAEQKIQLGAELTQGLGAGARPEVGKAAAEETLDLIVEHLRGAHMAFITAGMGGGTGTGAAPIIAQAAREKGILTVGVVTKPFQFEGNRRFGLAEQGIAELSQYVDTLIIIPNQNLFRIANERTTFADAFAMADEVLHSGVRGITDLMVMPGLVNLDFADVRTVMNEMGKAMMGTGEADGEQRALEAAEAAISNPLLDEVSMKGAKGVLINITGGMDLTLFEVDEAANRIRSEVDPEANILVGSALNPDLDGKMRVSVVATGIDSEGRPLSEMPKKSYSFETKPESVKEETATPSAPSTPVSEIADVEEKAPVVEEKMMEEKVEPASSAEVTTEDSFKAETESLLNQLSEEVVRPRVEASVKAQMAEQTHAQDVEEKEEPFIAPEASLPPKTYEIVSEQSDPFAEADMANGATTKEEPRKKRGLFSSLLGGNAKKSRPHKEPVLKQGELLSNSSPETVVPNPLKDRAKEQEINPLTAGERISPKTEASGEDDHLEIPAFLRRQAN